MKNRHATVQRSILNYSPLSILISKYFSIAAIEGAIDQARNAGNTTDFSTFSDAMRLRTGLFVRSTAA